MFQPQEDLNISNFLSNNSYVGINNKDFYYENFIFDIYLLVVKNLKKISYKMFDKKFLDFILVVVYLRSGLLDLLSRKKLGLFADSSILVVCCSCRPSVLVSLLVSLSLIRWTGRLKLSLLKSLNLSFILK